MATAAVYAATCVCNGAFGGANIRTIRTVIIMTSLCDTIQSGSPA